MPETNAQLLSDDGKYKYFATKQGGTRRVWLLSREIYPIHTAGLSEAWGPGKHPAGSSEALEQGLDLLEAPGRE